MTPDFPTYRQNERERIAEWNRAARERIEAAGNQRD
jgi:hypothetical protein